jgi:hypothetical protein
VIDEISQGRWPHWNPYAFCGEPLYANHLVPLTHPPLLIALLTAPWDRVHTVEVFLTLWLGSLGLYLFLRSKRLQPASALAAVALYLASGHYMITQYFQMRALMYYPWLLWASDALDENPSFRTLGAFSILMGLLLAAGHPAYVVPFVYMLILYRVLVWIFQGGKSARWKKGLGFLLAGLILGSMVSAVQNIPTWQLMSESSRSLSQVPSEESQTVPVTAAGTGSTASPAPVVDAKPSRAAVLFTPVFQRRSVLSHPYMGFPLILLGLLGILIIRPPSVRLALVCVLLVFSLLSVPPVFTAVFRFIPGLAISPFIPIATPQFILVILAGYGIDALVSGGIGDNLKAKWTFTAMSILSAVALVLLYIPPAIIHPDTRWENEQVPLAVTVLVISLVAILTPAVTWWVGRSRAWIGGMILPLALTVGGIPGHFYMYPVFDRLPIMPVTRSISALPLSPEYRVALHTSGKPARAVCVESPAPFGGNLPMWAGCYYAQGYNSFVLEPESALLKQLDPYTLQNDRNSLPLSDPSALSSPILDAMAVGYLISDDSELLTKPESGMNPGDWSLIHSGGLNIYKRNNALSRWHLADEPDSAEGIRNPTDSPSRVISLIEENPQKLEFRVSTPVGRYFVLSDCQYPEWHAFIDGNETGILTANGAYRAISVPPGEHEVIFMYIPTAFYAGIGVSLGALLVIFIGVLVESKRIRKG